MQCYPAYTVRRIEDELSYREIDELSKTWEENRPMSVNLRILNQLVAGYMGVELNQPKNTIEAAKTAFRMLGF